MQLKREIRKFDWEKLGRILKPNHSIPWLYSHTSSPYAVHLYDDIFDIYLTTRDKNNISRIGKAKLKLEPKPQVIEISDEPIINIGENGEFDDRGTSYPAYLKNGTKQFLFYTGWCRTVDVPFQNFLGLCLKNENRWEKMQNSPIIGRTKDEPISIGSCDVLFDHGLYKMWYTSFNRWLIEKGKKPKHIYNIKYAESKDGIKWKTFNHVCIDFELKEEYAISKPSVIKIDGLYYMFYSYRGNKYLIGLAFSHDGKNWERIDKNSNLLLSENGWDSEELCYPNIFKFKDNLYMLYCGNDYGNSGIGLAKSKI